MYEYGVERFFVMSLKSYQIVQECDLDLYSMHQSTFDDNRPCNIYFIMKRPKVTVDPKSVIIKNKSISFDFLIQEKSNFSSFKIDLDFPDVTSKINFKSNYPYNLFSIYDGDTHLMTARPGTLLDESYVDKLDVPKLDFEILYIGQSYGQNGNRMAIDRLSSHSTLQKINSDIIANHPDSDVFILLANFTQLNLLTMNGLIKTNPKNVDVDEERAQHFFENYENLFSEKQKINFTEAALIRYFKPKYNIEFKESFPKKTHKSYSECYDLDIKAMGIELDTSEIQRVIYTDNIEKKSYHFMDFSFDSREDRFNLLNLITSN